MTNVRVRRKRNSAKGGIPASIKKQIEQIVEAQEQIAELQADMKQYTAEVIGFMDTHNLSHIDGVHNTQMDSVVKKGRNSSVIDPEQLNGIVKGADFYSCVKVILKNAQNVVPGNALTKLKTVVPGKDSTSFEASRKD